MARHQGETSWILLEPKELLASSPDAQPWNNNDDNNNNDNNNNNNNNDNNNNKNDK